jgi:hypothetical protein
MSASIWCGGLRHHWKHCLEQRFELLMSGIGDLGHVANGHLKPYNHMIAAMNLINIITFAGFSKTWPRTPIWASDVWIGALGHVLDGYLKPYNHMIAAMNMINIIAFAGFSKTLPRTPIWALCLNRCSRPCSWWVS